MSEQEAFGGDWTQDKLNRLREYLVAYQTILSKYPFFDTVYVDAFAGTGVIPTRSVVAVPSASDPAEADVAGFLVGSARVALGVDPPFGHYLFVERSPKKAAELGGLRNEFPNRAASIEIVRADANEFLMEWVAQTDWKRTRAVVFLDPCGMQVEWRLLAALGATRAVDLWLLVPIGMGVNRLLTQNELPPKEWQARLSTFFGTDEWVDRCYRAPLQTSMFGDGPSHEKAVRYDDLAAYFTERLRTVFKHVAPRPLTQRNTRNSPMFMLTFATTNQAGLKIASYLLERTPRR
jgi:three-Cys-motif partner protein